MTEAEVQKLRDAGISDDVILGMQKEEAGKNGQAAPAAEVASALPDVDPNTPSKAYAQAQAAGVPTEGRGPSLAQTATELGAVAAPYIPHAVATGVGGYGLYKARQGINALDRGLGAVESMAETNAMREARLQNRPGFGGTPRPAVPTAPVAPAAAVPTAPGPIAPAGVPTAPAAPIAQAAEQGVMNRAKQVVQQLAMSKLAPMAGNLLKGANIASLAGYSSDLGPKTPQTGRMRGMEINPLTNAPWTPEQIRQYEANPAVYDQQMAPPQFRR